MRRRLTMAVSVLVLLPILIGGFIIDGRSQETGARLFQDVLRRVAHDGLDTLSSQELYERAARGLIEQIDDPYADLYSPEQLAQFSRQTIGNTYGGVGMQIEDQDGMVTVTRVFPNTPAEAGGVLAGDRIVAVDGESTRGWRLDDVSEALRGVPGTDVDATFVRSGVGELIEITLTRAEVHVPAVPYAILLTEDVGYIPVQRFNDAAAREVAESLQRLGEQGARTYVLDLRGNPGGSLDQAIDISDLFLDRGDEIASVRYRSQPEEMFQARRDPPLAGVPMVILTDRFTASASEIVAGALQDHDRALIVGTITFGKGVVQNLFPLEDGWALKLTTGKWYTPVGRTIQRELTAHAADSLGIRERPEFRSDAGRIVYGGGGITPDLVVRSDTLTTAEQEFMQVLSPQSQQSYVALYDLALRLKADVESGFEVTQAWRDAYYEALMERGVELDRAVYDAAAPLVNRWIGNRVAYLAFGDSASFRRSVASDRQVQAALDLLADGSTLNELFALAEERRARGPSE